MDFLTKEKKFLTTLHGFHQFKIVASCYGFNGRPAGNSMGFSMPIAGKV